MTNIYASSQSEVSHANYTPFGCLGYIIERHFSMSIHVCRKNFIRSIGGLVSRPVCNALPRQFSGLPFVKNREGLECRCAMEILISCKPCGYSTVGKWRRGYENVAMGCSCIGMSRWAHVCARICVWWRALHKTFIFRISKFMFWTQFLQSRAVISRVFCSETIFQATASMAAWVYALFETFSKPQAKLSAVASVMQDWIVRPRPHVSRMDCYEVLRNLTLRHAIWVYR